MNYRIIHKKMLTKHAVSSFSKCKKKKLPVKVSLRMLPTRYAIPRMAESAALFRGWGVGCFREQGLNL